MGHPGGVRLIGTTELTALQDAEASEEGIEAISDLEREQLRLADRLVSPGGDSAALYRRYYEMELPPPARIGVPLALPDGVAVEGDPDPGAPLRILYLGSLTRGKGAGDLAEACLRLATEDWELTMAGPDSETTTFRQSMQDSIEEMFRATPGSGSRTPPSSRSTICSSPRPASTSGRSRCWMRWRPGFRSSRPRSAA